MFELLPRTAEWISIRIEINLSHNKTELSLIQMRKVEKEIVFQWIHDVESFPKIIIFTFIKGLNYMLITRLNICVEVPINTLKI